jgi:hypothetical protein
MSVESAWNNSITNPAHYAFGESASVNNFANAASTGNALIGNKVYGTSAKPAIFLGQVQDAAARALVQTILKSNIVYSGVHNYQLELLEQNAGELKFGNLSDNDFFYGATNSNIVLPRDNAHFAILKGNSLPDNSGAGAVPIELSSGSDINAYLAIGAFNGSINVGVITVPTTFNTKPTSITVTGVFRVWVPRVGSSLNPTNVILDLTRSSKNLAVLTLTGLAPGAGLAAGDTLWLMPVDETSKIVINF